MNPLIPITDKPTTPECLYGLHGVMEALDAGKTIDKILLRKDLQAEWSDELHDKARQLGVPVQLVPVQKLDRITRKNHQGVIALLAAVDYYKVDQLVPALFEAGENPFMVVLDGVTDVRNFGAIARTCECAGVSAIVIPERGSVSVNADAVKTSAGALNHLPVCRVSNLVRAVRYLRDSGFRIVGTSDKNAQIYTEADYTGPVALVLGAEDEGISNDVMRLCDDCVAIPEFGNIHSLNVSVAAGVMIYEVVRQRMADNQRVM
ncbi:MAG: 23S rRNA (guanosine(2251)-2'-O)-methyltransferase RlmB [Muribaculaceae bacterium]|nr:23S rRNA (guanosine(2251)-2'-O)-methyltransferase RlmB [Muribaculaceae bacterium]